MDLKTYLPQLLPTAIAWAESQAEHVAAVGSPLPARLIPVALAVGVRHPELIRVKLVDKLPSPDDPTLHAAAIQAGLLGPNMVGLTLGHSIFIVSNHDTIRLISHECRHVHQYEEHGSIRNFLPIYLNQVLDKGYENAPLEKDARDHEIESI